MIAALLKSWMKRRNFTERRTITCYEKSSTNQRADNDVVSGLWGEQSGLLTHIATGSASVSLFCRHLVLDDAYDGHEDGAANPAATDVGKNPLKIHPTAAAGRSGSHYHVENCAAQSATDNSGDGIPEGTEAALFHRCAGNIAADSATDYLNDKTNDVHRLFCWLILLSVFRCDVLLAKAAT